MKANVLGTEYDIEFQTEYEDKMLQRADGYCDETVNKIVIQTFETSEDEIDRKANMDLYKKKVLRHELIHAFMMESGLGCCAEKFQDEEVVDFFAIQFPKMLECFQEVGCI